MSRPYLKKIILVAGGVTVPALLMVCVEAWMSKMGLAALRARAGVSFLLFAL